MGSQGSTLPSGLISGWIAGAPSASAARGSRTKGRTSHSMSSRRKASAACASVSAATATPNLSPTQVAVSPSTFRSRRLGKYILSYAAVFALVHALVVGLSPATSGSAYVSTSWTPGAAAARVASSRAMRAWGRGLRRILACSIPGKRLPWATSSRNSAWPPAFSWASMRGRYVPTNARGLRGANGVVIAGLLPGSARRARPAAARPRAARPARSRCSSRSGTGCSRVLRGSRRGSGRGCAPGSPRSP